jgi:nicotinamidase-related amidase
MSPEVSAKAPPLPHVPLPHVDGAALAGMLDPSRTALVVIDVQQDFTGPHGAMARIGLDLSGVELAIDRIEHLIAAARGVGAQVAFARVMSSAATDSSALKLLNARKGRPPGAIGICREDAEGSGYYRVAPQPGDIEVLKRLFDSFHGTDFEADLKARGIDTLVFVGFTTDCCVDATARAAFHRDFNVFVVSDACDAYDPDLHLGALRALQKNVGLLTTTADVLAAWSSPS